MKRLVGLMAAGVILACAHQQAHATAITNRITFALTVFTQGAFSTVGDIETAKVNKTKVTNKEVLGVLANQTGNQALNQPGNFIEAALPDTGTNIVVVKDKTGAVLADVSPYITVAFGAEDIYIDKYNTSNGQENSTDYFLMSFHLSADNNTIDVFGFATDKYVITPVKNGTQNESSTLTVSVSGNGMVKDGSGTPREAVIQGTVSLKGKDTLTTP